MSEAILSTENLTKRFGGLAAVAEVNLNVAERGIHAIIGPNGAGKSTIINLLTGQLAPTEGRIRFGSDDITGLKPHRVARLGIGRSYQRTNIFPTFSCLENCWLAAQACLPSSMRFLRRASRLTDVRERAEQALGWCALGHRRNTRARAMSYGEQRQLEIAMVLATEPRFLLLDEPMAGMGHEESERVADLLADLGTTYPIVLVEHDMDAVFSIATDLTVMVNGRVVASGPLAAVRGDPVVQEAYLGDGEEVY